MTGIRLRFVFHQPFRIASGASGAGDDETLDLQNPLPATSIKGLLRDAARLVLPGQGNGSTYVDAPLVRAVFGARGGAESPWHFEDAVIAGQPQVKSRVRIALNANRRVQAGAILLGQELYADSAQSEVWLKGHVPKGELSRHVALLTIAPRLIDGIGSDRRRGLGWVTVSTDPVPSADGIAEILEPRP